MRGASIVASEKAEESQAQQNLECLVCPAHARKVGETQSSPSDMSVIVSVLNLGAAAVTSWTLWTLAWQIAEKCIRQCDVRCDILHAFPLTKHCAPQIGA